MKHEYRGVDSDLPQPLAESAEIGSHPGLDKGIGDHRVEPGQFAHLR